MTAISSAALAADLHRALAVDARDDALTRTVYSTDASLYRVRPAAVVFPRDADQVCATVEWARERGISVTARGAGTSVAGNAVGPGIVVDFSRHMNRVLSLDPDARAAVVQPGTVHASLQRRALAQGLRFGPDPSTHTRCTIGGMIGNNACGSRTLGYGRTVDNVLALEVLTGTGRRLVLDGGDAPDVPEVAALRDLVGAGLATIRTEFGRFGRQVSGYALEHLLPERGFDVRRMLVGSEGTLATVLEATVRLVADPAHRILVALGFADFGAAGDAVTAVLPYRPTACEGIDSRIVDVVRAQKGAAAVPELPAGAAWLFVEIAGEDRGEVSDRARAVAGLSPSSRIVDDPAQARRLWKIREDGAGLSGRSSAGASAYSGWEDAAVPPERLGAYLRDFDALMAEHRLDGFPYGHFGDGCVHVRLDFPFDAPDGTARFRRFMGEAAELVARFGGTLSGEHGDGRARSELLPVMYSSEAMALFGRVKRIFDPGGLMNPGVITDPAPLDRDIGPAAARPLRTGLVLRYRHDDGDLSRAVHRCTGVGVCRADNGAQDVMCPSYLATREEKDSTRGRARLLQEMIGGERPAWNAPEVRESLDLCLSCKGCLSDCPTGIDMAAYKAEVTHQAYRGRLRPVSHYSLGWLPRWGRLAAPAAGLVNAAMRLPLAQSVATRLAGVDPRRRIPEFATERFPRWFRKRRRAMPAAAAPRGPVLLWADSFTSSFTPEVAQAAVRVLERAGYEVRIPEGALCCGLTWISTGQLTAARRILRATVGALTATAEAGIPIVGIEPSCTGVLRSDAAELLGTPEADAVARATRTLAELLGETPGWEPPSLEGVEVVAQPHCHHHAVMGWEQDAALLERAGARLRRLGGCCGLAGNFGTVRGHYEVSVAVAEQQLLPAVRDAGESAVILADGYSCRTQLADLSDRRGIHLAQLLDAPPGAEAGGIAPASQDDQAAAGR